MKLNRRKVKAFVKKFIPNTLLVDVLPSAKDERVVVTIEKKNKRSPLEEKEINGLYKLANSLENRRDISVDMERSDFILIRIENTESNRKFFN